MLNYIICTTEELLLKNIERSKTFKDASGRKTWYGAYDTLFIFRDEELVATIDVESLFIKWMNRHYSNLEWGPNWHDLMDRYLRRRFGRTR